MCQSNLLNSMYSPFTKTIGRGVKKVLTETPILKSTGGQQMAQGLEAVGGYLENEFAGIPLASDVATASNEFLTGSNVADRAKAQADADAALAASMQDNLGDAPDPLDPDSEEAILAMQRARYLADQRRKRYLGRQGTIVTGGMGLQGGAPLSKPELTGRKMNGLRWF